VRALSGTLKAVIRGGPRRLILEFRFSFVVNLMRAYRLRGSLAPKPLGGRRHAKLDPHRVFLLRRVAEKDNITMPEGAGDLAAACGAKADPASLSRWLIRNGYRFKEKRFWPGNAIAPTFTKRARNGGLSGNRRCGSSTTGWSSSTRPEPPRK
jgi:transposase